MALETPSRPPPFMANVILNFHFDYLNPSLRQQSKSIHDFTSTQHPAPPRLSPHAAVPLRMFQLFNCFNLYHRLCEKVIIKFAQIACIGMKASSKLINAQGNHIASGGVVEISRAFLGTHLLKRKRVVYLGNCITEVKNHLASTKRSLQIIQLVVCSEVSLRVQRSAAC